jgi:hypothetical protein
MQDCGAAVVTAATGDSVVPFYLSGSVWVQGPGKSENAIAGLNFERYRLTENETAGGKRSWLDGSSALKQGVSKPVVPLISKLPVELALLL